MRLTDEQRAALDRQYTRVKMELAQGMHKSGEPAIEVTIRELNDAIGAALARCEEADKMETALRESAQILGHLRAFAQRRYDRCPDEREYLAEYLGDAATTLDAARALLGIDIIGHEPGEVK